jgi:V/A-type H+-transporting ATPase subunit I
MTLRPVPARWFELLTSKEELAKAVEVLAETQSVELETHSDEVSRINLPDLQDQLEEFNRMAHRYHTYWPEGDFVSGGIKASPEKVLNDALAHLKAWESDASIFIQKYESLIAEASDLELIEDMFTQLDDDIDFSLFSRQGPVVVARVYLMPDDERYEHVPASVLLKEIITEDHYFILAVGEPEKLSVLSEDLGMGKAKELTIPRWIGGNKEVAMVRIRARLQEITKNIHRIQFMLSDCCQTHRLSKSLADIYRMEWFLTHVSDLPVTENFAWVTGWTSDVSGGNLKQSLEQEGLNVILRFPDAPMQSRAPMVMNNPWWAQPFELFSGMLGTPSAEEADPSLLVAILVPLLFGYMFGDVGHGLVLAIIGLMLQKRWPITRILIANGVSSIFFGFMFGSIFGLEHLIPALWVHPIEQPLLVMAVPLVAGVFILTSGLALNAFEYVWRGEFADWLKVDAPVTLMYLSLIGLIVSPVALYPFLAGLVWYFVGSLSKAEKIGVASIVGSAGALVEHLFQLLINSISFVRVGAFALAHAGLSLAFFTMAESTDSIFLAIFIMLIGNVIVILLEGLVVTIQTTRLILFEFFIRFLRGSGRMFRPLAAPSENSDTRR